MKFLKWLGYLALVGLFVWFVFLRNLDNDSGSIIVESATADEEEIDSFIDEDFESDFIADTTEFVDEFEEIDEFLDPIPQEENAPEIESSSALLQYLVVVGSFGENSYAEAMKERLHNKGVDAQIVYARNMFRVVVGSSNSQTEAQQIRDQSSLNGEPAFILKQD
jgi:aspartokinase